MAKEIELMGDGRATHDDPVPRKSKPAELSGRLSQLVDVSFRRCSLQERRSDDAPAAIAG
jgi:hypothetical protein